MQTAEGLVQHRVLRRMYKAHGATSTRAALLYLGCSWREAADHLTAQLKEGQTLKEMRFDHIIPITNTDDEEARKRMRSATSTG